MKFVDKHTIEVDRELSTLDRFALDFIAILQTHTPYVIVSGYVSILLGRARASEDIDIIIPKLSRPALNTVVQDLQAHGFYCINETTDEEIFDCLNENLAVRFARQNTMIPNIEMKWATTTIHELALKNPVTVKIGQRKLQISNLELQIAFKETVLKSPKDREDARHLEKIAEKYLDKTVIKHYKEILRDVH